MTNPAVKKSIIGIVVLFLFSFLLSHMAMLYEVDISLEAPSAQQKNIDNTSVYLITYADGPPVFRKNQNTLAASAINKGVDFIFMYGRHHLPQKFLEQNRYILNHPQGAGFWLWKPWIILHTLEKAPDNAIVIYLDSGFLITDHLQPLLDLTKKTPMIFVAHDDLGTTVQSVTQNYTLMRMGCTKKCLTSPHLMAGLGVYKNTHETRRFVKKWLEWCQIPEIIMPLDLLNLANFSSEQKEKMPGFLHHHHDEAILSVLYHQNPKDITTLPLSALNQMRILRWHHRHPPSEAESLLPYMHKNIKFLQKKLYWVWTWPLEKIKNLSFFTKTHA